MSVETQQNICDEKCAHPPRMVPRVDFWRCRHGVNWNTMFGVRAATVDQAIISRADHLLVPSASFSPNPCVEVVAQPKGGTVVVNLYAGPGAGKSTLAAELFAKMKQRHINAELVPEYVKRWVWQGRVPGAYDQPSIFGKQLSYESSLFGKAEAFVTDSPLPMQAAYALKYAPGRIADGVTYLARAFRDQTGLDSHEHIDIWVPRRFPYQEKGRYESEDQAVQMDDFIKKVLDTRFGIKPTVLTEWSSTDQVVDTIEAKVAARRTE